jgi:hypothetical protein
MLSALNLAACALGRRLVQPPCVQSVKLLFTRTTACLISFHCIQQLLTSSTAASRFRRETFSSCRCLCMLSLGPPSPPIPDPLAAGDSCMLLDEALRCKGANMADEFTSRVAICATQELECGCNSATGSPGFQSHEAWGMTPSRMWSV